MGIAGGTDGEPHPTEKVFEDGASRSAEEHAEGDVSADYINTPVREAMTALQQTPDYEHLAYFLTALRSGYLFADVTGTQKKKTVRARTIRSTKGELLLVLFTSMSEVRAAYPAGRRDHVKGAMMPAREALSLIRTSPFVAIQFDVGSSAMVVLRKYIELVLGDEVIDADAVKR